MGKKIVRGAVQPTRFLNARERLPLDALHLATAVVAQGWMGPIQVWSLDQRIRDNARLLGFPLEQN